MTRRNRSYLPGKIFFFMVILLLLSGVSVRWFSVLLAQDEIPELRPMDMILVIDNSGSMFPETVAKARGYDTWGSDPDFLRILGANIFIASLGFAEPNEDQYQLGIVNLGEHTRLLSPLQPLQPVRDILTNDIDNPEPEASTRIIPALERAYRELHTSPKRRSSNVPAIVLITDGVPYPPEGQSNADIEQLLRENPGIHLFVMLIQNPDARVPERQKEEMGKYVNFWQQMQSRYAHVVSYKIESESQIHDTYHDIVSFLQNTNPAPSFSVGSGSPKEIHVGKYVRRIAIKVAHQPGKPKGEITITDPEGVLVRMDDPGVQHFRGSINPVEVISISRPRLSDALKMPANENPWTIASDTDVVIFLDRRGAYRINILEPSISLTDFSNVYLATEQQSPDLPLDIRFNLIKEDRELVTEPQPVEGEFTCPDGGTENSLRVGDIFPNHAGVYQLPPFDATRECSLDEPGRIIFVLKAGAANDGAADDTTGERIPVAKTHLLVDFGRGPNIETITPDPIICSAGQPITTTVHIGNYETARTDTVAVRIFGDKKDILLAPNKPGIFEGDIAPLCNELLAPLSCGSTLTTTLQVRVSGSLQADGTPFPPVERDLVMEVQAPACPPPTPIPTPIPDTDRDGLRDPQDDCPETWGLEWFDGCLPLWFVILIILVTIAGAVVTFFRIIPCIFVRIRKPPQGYIEVTRTAAPAPGVGKPSLRQPPSGPSRAPTSSGAKAPPRVYSVSTMGMSGCTSRVTVGGRRFLFWKDTIYVPGLKPGHFVVQEQGGQTVLEDNTQANMPISFEETVRSVAAGNVTLRICLKRENLK
jgi:hypothetical protein